VYNMWVRKKKGLAFNFMFH